MYIYIIKRTSEARGFLLRSAWSFLRARFGDRELGLLTETGGQWLSTDLWYLCAMPGWRREATGARPHKFHQGPR